MRQMVKKFFVVMMVLLAFVCVMGTSDIASAKVKTKIYKVSLKKNQLKTYSFKNAKIIKITVSKKGIVSAKRGRFAYANLQLRAKTAGKTTVKVRVTLKKGEKRIYKYIVSVKEKKDTKKKTNTNNSVSSSEKLSVPKGLSLKWGSERMPNLTVSWNSVPNAACYQIEFYASDSSKMLANSITFETSYSSSTFCTVSSANVRVRALTSEPYVGRFDNNDSDWSQPVQFIGETYQAFQQWRFSWEKENWNDSMTTVEKLRTVAQMIVTNFEYGNEVSSIRAWVSGKADCIGGANLLQEFCKDLEVKSDLTSAPIGGNNHHCLIVWIDGQKWRFDVQGYIGTPDKGYYDVELLLAN